ncbi:alpha-amylase family protein [Actinoallomurus rhizosphaericola]|uniref:alpha-amylase family protein n=1 Tax=Actinoallomurus rhizosphaericola TaxID=2952536 RepID=UPI002091EA72|nr:alpha-amylase family protein [Actinoallomurus rhizosphaericola]MCO5997204.1 alpha-amylase family protein [Actinoallomurus rhizosphaericola]
MTDKATSDLWWKNAVVYCVDVATWLDTDDDGVGDLSGLTRRLDYLSGLGVNCLWLMPFYPSPLRDDGYDITDYYAVDQRFGSLGDFVEMLRTADDLGIRVLVDLVLNHTSNEHRWFRDRPDYYVWSDHPRKEPSEVAFPGEQDGTWSYDEARGQWYMHRYYDFMPDLDITKPEVRDEMNKILGFWLELGISGFRVDSLPFMIETVGTDCRDNPVSFLRSMVEFLERRRGDAIFLGEANVSPEEQQRYFGLDGGEGVQMLFDFRGCAAQWLSHARGDVTPLAEALRNRPAHPVGGQFANFCRHHDELNLGLLSESERDEVFAAFAPEETHRVYGRGIRRRLAPMLGNDPRRIRLVLALTLALPGTPVILYGDEIGMGEDLSLRGRLAVRTPMQWSARPNGGFSRAKEVYRPVLADGEYGFREVNVIGQRQDPDSLYSWTSRAIRVRRECPEFGWGEWEILDVGDTRVLGLAYRWRDGRVVTLHNVSADPVRVKLPDDLDLSGVEQIRQIFGDAPAIELGREIELAGYGYRWLRLIDDEVTTAII